jgi:hypothetical protein
MPCQALKFRPRSFVETMELAGFRVRDDMTSAKLKELDAELAERSSIPATVCGPGKQEPICACGYVAEILCDWPMGDGKTCDLPLCPSCAHEIGEDKHTCEIHWHEFKQRTGVRRMFPSGPRIVK